MFGLLPRLYVYGAIAAAALVGFAWFVHSIRKDARNNLLHSIERTENNARDKAISGARSVDACYDAGGVWNRSDGTCRLPEGQR